MESLIKKIGNVDLEITFDCNLRCLHCYNENHKKTELSKEKIFDIINQINELGFKEIHITGGEPLKHKKIVDILKYCEYIELNILLETNATLLDSKLISKIKSIKNLNIRASIDGPERIHNYIRKSKEVGNPYIESVKGLLEAKKEGLGIQTTTSVNKLNYEHILDMIDDLYGKGIDDSRLRLSMPSNSGYFNWQKLKLNFENLICLKEQVDEINANYPIKFNSDSLFRQSPGKEYKCFITPQGDVKPYPFINSYAGNIKKDSLKNILNKYVDVIFPVDVEKLMSDYLLELKMK